MSRGPGGAGRMGGKDLPFEVDANVESELAAYRAEAGDDDDWVKTLYPDIKIPEAPPFTPEERRGNDQRRRFREAIRKGPLYFDPPVTGKRNPADFNAFEDQPTYNNKRQKQSIVYPDLSKVCTAMWIFPKDCQDYITGQAQEDVEAVQKRKRAQLKKKRLDRLAQLDDDADVDGAAGDNDDVADDDDDENGEDDGIGALQDDDFDEGDDDLGNDYNAEQYFENGEGADDDAGDDGGGADEW